MKLNKPKWYMFENQTMSSPPIAYICSPYSGDIERNTRLACCYARYAVDEGYTPIVPHLLFPQFMDENTERAQALTHAKNLLSVCDEIWVFAKPSEGMREELKTALALGLRVRVFTALHAVSEYDIESIAIKETVPTLLEDQEESE